MQDTAKYLIHADITADGVVERSDVVGAIFGQTEGLLGDDLDLRDLQDSSKVGRIDVDIDSAHGQSFGEITIATSLDKVKTAILAAALETIDRVGPCRSTIDVETIEDVRAAKRREVVDRAKGLLQESFDGSILSSEELVAEVRQALRVEDVTEYEGYPAGPRVPDSDAIIVVEGRADVLQLLTYGIKNAIAVEGTNVPDPIARLTKERTVTTFLDGDRGGELILKELAQVGNIDFVAFAPSGESVEDLSRSAVMAALREKAPYEMVADTDEDGSVTVADDPEAVADEATIAPKRSDGASTDPDRGFQSVTDDESDDETGEDTESVAASADDDEASEASEKSTDGETDEESDESPDQQTPRTLGGHVDAVIDGDTGLVRLLDADFDVLEEGEAADAFRLVRDAEPVPETVVLDGEASQRLLDVAAQRGVAGIVAATTGEFVKQPANVRVRTADELRQPAEQ
ncbi:DNA primase DnaG [Halosegnis longus]|uniref:DNA primase DnaG n=1 Tax=Halosegnis longus TaxID=2216012 RepID=A0AAJ4UV87_9EURY|nr:DNA primase DnaG [Halosegnis longus]RNJ25674.1 DNA primase [Salella cibi]